MLNKTILMGRLTAEPELRRTQNNTSVTSFTLAVNRSYARQGEQAQTDFIDVVAWSSTAEFVTKWFHKGMLVAVCGRLQTRTWEDGQGPQRSWRRKFTSPSPSGKVSPSRSTGTQHRPPPPPCPLISTAEWTSFVSFPMTTANSRSNYSD